MRVAIIGSGPAGFYAAEALLKRTDAPVDVDLFDRLPTPYGLVRGGVAPDHQKIKAVDPRLREHRGAARRFRFLGNVQLGRDVSVEELRRHYHQIVYATGNEADRRLGIPGRGHHPLHAGHGLRRLVQRPPRLPQRADRPVRRAASRWWATATWRSTWPGSCCARAAELRRPTSPRTRWRPCHERRCARSSSSAGAGRTRPHSPRVSSRSSARWRTPTRWSTRRARGRRRRSARSPARETWSSCAPTPPGRPARTRRKLHLRFLVSPTEILADAGGGVAGLALEKNRLEARPDGSVAARGTGEIEVLDVGMVLPAMGFAADRIAGRPLRRQGAHRRQRGRAGRRRRQRAPWSRTSTWSAGRAAARRGSSASTSGPRRRWWSTWSPTAPGSMARALPPREAIDAILRAARA